MPRIGRRAILAAHLVLPALARAQEAWPTRPLRLICPFPPGGVTDLYARLVATQVERALGQNVVVENRAGVGGNVGAEAMARATPDGYTFGIATPSNVVTNPMLMRSMPYDPWRDLAPLSLFAINPNIIVVHPDVPARTPAELAAWLKAHPGTSFASPGVGTTQHLTGQLFALAAGAEVQHVPYRGSQPALLDLMAGRVPMMVDVVVTSLPLHREGKLRAIAVSTHERLPGAPDIATVAETYPGFEATSWIGFVVAAGTPAPVRARLSAAIAAAAKAPEVVQRVTESAAFPVGSTAEEFAAFLLKEKARWEPAVKASGATIE